MADGSIARRMSASIANLPLGARLIACAASGGAAALAQPPWGLWPLALVGVAAAHILWRGADGLGWGRQFAIGWAVGAGYFGVALHWIVEPFFVDAMR
ncbi:MAG: apolipoprotein N-acyltransferase, partial [Pseudomonadota bacterium]